MDQKQALEKEEQLSQLSRKELVKIILNQQQIITELQIKIEKLILSRDLNSKNSSKPPSSDLLKKPEKKQQKNPQEKQPKKKKPGGQLGHPGKTRKGFGRVDRYELLKAEKCSSCGQLLESGKTLLIEKKSALKDTASHIAVLVERPIEIVEYQRHHTRCKCCGETTIPAWPNQIIPGQDLGIKLQGLLGWLGNYGNLPYEKQQELLWELGRIKVGVGTLVATNQRISAAIKPSLIELQEWINQNHPTLNIDETPWPVKGLKEWLWVFANPNFCLFRAGDTRSRAEIQDQLGIEYPGVIISDDFSVYNGYPVAAQQKCQAHLRRHCQKLITTPGQDNKSIGKALTEIIDQAFKQHRLWRETSNQQNYLDSATELKTRINLTLKKWIEKAGYEAGKILRNLKLKADQWWYFLDHPEITPDNNLAERALRLAVTKRKVSGGSHCLERFQETADLLSVIQTCRFQGRSVMDFFTQSLMATADVHQRPSLVSHLET
ncbi:MAG: IS66 family transposase [Cyanobacteria bacterium P01_F01_bin.143]